MRNSLIISTTMICMATLASAAVWWIDSDGTGDGTSENSSSQDFYSVAEMMSDGDTMMIRGGEGREYFFDTSTSMVFRAENILISGYGTEKPLFVVTNFMAFKDNSTGLSNVTDYLIDIYGEGTTISGLDFEIREKVNSTWIYSIFHTRRLINIRSAGVNTNGLDNVTVRNCDFTGVNDGTNSSLSIICNTFTKEGGNNRTNSAVINCTFKDLPDSNFLIRLAGKRERIIENTFLNCGRIANAEKKCGERMQFISNKVVNISQTEDKYLFNANYMGMENPNFSYNIFYNDDANTTRCMLVQNYYTATGGGSDALFCNNTMINFGGYCKNSNPKEKGTQKFYNNLFIGNNTPLLKNTTGTNLSWNATTEVRNNVWVGVPYIFDDGYDSCLFESNITGNISVERVSFYKSKSYFDTDFLRPRGDVTAEVLNGIGNLNEFGSFPLYIGAVEPRKGEAVSLLIVR